MDSSTICDYRMIKYMKKTAQKFKTDIIVEITSDNPLVDPRLTEKVIAEFLCKSDQFDFMSNDKKNDDKKINLILLRKIGQTTRPGAFKLSVREMKKYFPKLSNFNL